MTSVRLKFENGRLPDEFYIQALLLAEVIKRIVKKRASLQISAVPKLQLQPILEFMKRMRVNGLTKFDEKTYISTVNFYENAAKMVLHQALGAIVLYIPEHYVVKLFRELEYPALEDEEESSLEDACGTFCNLIAGNFKTGLTQLGYRELVMSHFSTFQNDILNGVEYDPTQKQLYEISFDIKEEKKIVVDFTMGLIPKLSDF